jgi:hypothetical protein
MLLKAHVPILDGYDLDLSCSAIRPCKPDYEACTILYKTIRPMRVGAYIVARSPALCVWLVRGLHSGTLCRCYVYIADCN